MENIVTRVTDTTEMHPGGTLPLPLGFDNFFILSPLKVRVRTYSQHPAPDATVVWRYSDIVIERLVFGCAFMYDMERGGENDCHIPYI